jgi:hypothetical protein
MVKLKRIENSLEGLEFGTWALDGAGKTDNGIGR